MATIENSQANVMPNVVPVRQCSSYNPAPFMREFQYDNGSRELYLEVKYRVDWFLHWCKENGVEGRIIESNIQYLPEIRMFLATCDVYINDILCAQSTAGRVIPESIPDANVTIQTAFTIAKGRALGNLGFGTVNGNTSEDGDMFPPDSGIPLPAVTAETNPLVVPDSEPVPTDTASTSHSEPAPKRRGRPPKAQTPPPAPEDNPTTPEPASAVPIGMVNGLAEKIPTTLDEAKAYICPVGISAGRSMGELEVTDPGKVDFYAGPKYIGAAKHPALVAAAQLIVANR